MRINFSLHDTAWIYKLKKHELYKESMAGKRLVFGAFISLNTQNNLFSISVLPIDFTLIFRYIIVVDKQTHEVCLSCEVVWRAGMLYAMEP